MSDGILQAADWLDFVDTYAPINVSSRWSVGAGLKIGCLISNPCVTISGLKYPRWATAFRFISLSEQSMEMSLPMLGLENGIKAGTRQLLE